MSFNLCHPVFHASIHCDKPTVDGYEADNLLRTAMCGFMTESFVRPPVIVVISFPFNVEIHSVIINSKVGSQASGGFEIWCQSEKIHENQRSTPEVTLTSPDSIKFNEQTFMQISKGCDISKQFFIFDNSSFRARPPYSNLNKMPKRHQHPDELVTHRNLRFRGVGWLNLVRRVAIRIVMNRPGSTCAMKWLEIWGQPSSSCSARLRNHLLSLHRSITNLNQEMPKLPCSGHVLERRPPTPETPTCTDTGSIPSDFLDPIVLEIMALPVLLPSGNTIDQSTLDRHISEEAKWGRPPNDPFTGMPFSDRHKPIPNAILKSRIDAFLLKGGTNLENVARTLGTNQANATSVSRLVTQHKHLNPGPAKSLNEKASKVPPRIPSKRSYRSISTTNGASSSLAKRPAAAARNIEEGTQQTLSAHPVLHASKKSFISPTTSHADRLRSSLDMELSNALSTLPSFLRSSSTSTASVHVPTYRSDTNGDTDTDDGCVSCHTVKGTPQRYMLACGHSLCRDCLMEAKTSSEESGAMYVCSMCKADTLSKDIVKLQSRTTSRR